MNFSIKSLFNLRIEADRRLYQPLIVHPRYFFGPYFCQIRCHSGFSSQFNVRHFCVFGSVILELLLVLLDLFKTFDSWIVILFCHRVIPFNFFFFPNKFYAPLKCTAQVKELKECSDIFLIFYFANSDLCQQVSRAHFTAGYFYVAFI